MKKIPLLFILCCQSLLAQYNPTADNLKAREAFQNDKFGMFIHWGVYSVLGDAEWVMNNQNITAKTYEKLPSFFNPTEFNAEEWVKIAKNAGMKYITITSKHHDGFAMWGSKVSPYNIVDATPYKKDVLKMLSAACEKEGIKLFFYHSHLDWHHPDYFPRGKTGLHTGRPESGNFDTYLNYMDQQLAELLGGNYGKIAGVWFDGWWDQASAEMDKTTTATHVDWQLKRTYDLIHKLNPAALIGNNHHVMPFEGEDFQMFERDLPGQNTFGYNTNQVSALPLETCETLNGAWGFQLSDQNYKSPKQLIHYLVNAAGRNANFLLNIGPMPNGKIQTEFTERLAAVGKWTAQNGFSIYGTRGGPVPPQEWGVSTQKSGVVYLHLLKMPSSKILFVPGYQTKINTIEQVNSKKQLKFKQQPEGTFVYLEGIEPNEIDTILELK
jgi:alpha-L-fucosidase